MTVTDQDEAAERAAKELARRLGPVTTLRDPYAAGMDFMAWLQSQHWRCIPPPPNVLAAREAGSPPTDEFKAAKAAIAPKETHSE
jgi:hypothetical protein